MGVASPLSYLLNAYFIETKKLTLCESAVWLKAGMRKRLIFEEAETQPNKSAASASIKELKPNRTALL